MFSSLHETLSSISTLPDTALLTQAEAAAYLRLAEQTLANDRAHRNLGIPFCRLGRTIRYPKSDVDKWRESCTVRGASISSK